MTRSTNYEKSKRLSRAFDLLANSYAAPRIVEELVGQFGISPRQASRYLLEAQQAGNPVPIAEPTIPMTIKIPQGIALKIRTYAHSHNLTIGELITHSVLAYLASERYHG